MSLTSHALLWLGFLVCFGSAALLAAAEVSLVRVRRAQVEVEGDTRPHRTRQLLRLLDELPIALNAVLLLALLCQVGAATIAGYWAQRTFGDVAVSVSSVVVTLLLFVYAEAIPKTMAVSTPLPIALRFAPLVKTITAMLRIPVRAVARFAELQAPGPTAFPTALTEQELLASAVEAAREGEIDEEDAGLIERSFAFGDTTVSSVMVARDEIVSVPAAATVADALTTSLESGHRRLLVLRAGLDDVAGMVRLRDLAATARTTPEAPAGTIATDALLCNDGEPIGAVLASMQSTGTHLAVVQGAAGATAGLVTIEDIVEELVGDIADDTPSAPHTR